jgi:site-specific DNA-methyltransferase (adenine-specific)
MRVAKSTASCSPACFNERYASSSRFFQYRHESAYLLADGDAPLPKHPLPDVLDFQYTGNACTRRGTSRVPAAIVRTLAS